MTNHASSIRTPLPVHQPATDVGPSNIRQIKFERRAYPGKWTRFVRQVLSKITSASTGSPSDGLNNDGSESSASASTSLGGLISAGQRHTAAEKDGGDWVLDEVVVDGEGGDRPGTHVHGSEKDTGTKQSESGQGSVRGVHGGYEGGSRSGGSTDAWDTGRDTGGLWGLLRWRLWPVMAEFFDPRFEDPAFEEDYQKQMWYSTKAFAFYGSLYLVLNWVLYLILNHSVNLYEKAVYYGGLTLVTLPIPFMVAFDMPRYRPVLFHTCFCLATWYCGLSEVIQIKECDFFNKTDNTCFGKDFLAMSYYSTGLPAMMMFIVSRRLYNAVVQAVFFVLLMTLIIPDQSIYARNVVSFCIFSVFIQALHYSREANSRRMYILNSQLKIAYRAQQKAQIAESKASHAKKRFASYIFHEVRVPLNTAMLAYQNMQTNDAFKPETLEEQSIEVYALEASLTMMQQVLNDALDLQKMDAGRFESHPRPFPLHRSLHNALRPIGVDTSAKRLELIIDLDERIDAIGFIAPPGSNINAGPITFNTAAVNAANSSSIRNSMNYHSPEPPPRRSYTPNSGQGHTQSASGGGGAGASGSGDGVWVIGDEIRLRQVLTNLASNAVKFTPEGGGPVKIVTRLVSAPSWMSTNAGSGTGSGAGSSPGSGTGSGNGTAVLSGHGGLEGNTNPLSRNPSTKTAPGIRGHKHSPRRSDERIGLAAMGIGLGGSTDGGIVGKRERDMVTIRLEVHDSGPGIRPSDLVDGRLFQPFVQTNVGKLSGKGSGLGLAIVRQIVSLSGGRLGVQSRKGQGAMFWVEMSYPLATTHEVQTSRSTLAPFAPMSTLSPPSAFASPNPTRSPRPILATIPSSEAHPAQDPSDSPTKSHALSTHSTESPLTKDDDTVNSPNLPNVDLSARSPTHPRSGSPPNMSMVLPPLPRYQSQDGHDDATESEHGSRPQDSPVNVVSPPGLTPTLPGMDDNEDKASDDPILERPVRPGPIVTPGPEGMGKAWSAPAASLSPTPVSQTAPASSSGEEGNPLVVLVVDDDPMTRTLMTRMLTKLGCVVDTADDGQQFLDIILAEGARKYDLVSLDNYMPVMTGEDAVRELRARGRMDLVVGCTGNALTEDQLNYMEAGADKVLTKPIMMKDLKDVLQVAKKRRDEVPPRRLGESEHRYPPSSSPSILR
ncbi:uncharacterized protein STEHIDRAFT_126395 [Stereum hirsutum FP-91666 SS1]|uniref:histidine kinase n=1 Tax=Stereum hirsutum (strain FP-91666) TaxID=721885 RepID=R7RY42_STEHR|nr:uncharacterized protein STEHIDRAFT_126395 [Stereum hirsutum FP-91666 SS1]EIM79723.1 hypothetical protein STEHIDRAFT_126395 [Stereum hirsutum FP-91666 SS1]